MLNHEDLETIRQILANCREYEEGHHMGRPFMSAYQIAIRFSELRPNHAAVLRLPIGGVGVEVKQSLTQRIALFLSSEIRSGCGADTHSSDGCGADTHSSTQRAAAARSGCGADTHSSDKSDPRLLRT